jgi:hypothetical protein
MGEDDESRCGHKQSSHLDSISICLDKSKVDLTGICICERFGVYGAEVKVISPKAIARKNLPKKFAAHFNRN